MGLVLHTGLSDHSEELPMFNCTIAVVPLQMQLAYKIIGVWFMEWRVANLPPICNLSTLLWQIWTSNLHIPTSSLSHQQFLQLQASEGQPKNITRKLKKLT